MAIAENLRGTFKVHVAYAVAQGTRIPPPMGKPHAIPHLRGVDARRLAQAVAQSGSIRLTVGAGKETLELPKPAAPLIAMIDGRTPLARVRARAGLDPIAFATLWGPVERGLCGFGQMHYSTLLAG